MDKIVGSFSANFAKMMVDAGKNSGQTVPFSGKSASHYGVNQADTKNHLNLNIQGSGANPIRDLGDLKNAISELKAAGISLGLSNQAQALVNNKITTNRVALVKLNSYEVSAGYSRQRISDHYSGRTPLSADRLKKEQYRLLGLQSDVAEQEAILKNNKVNGYAVLSSGNPYNPLGSTHKLTVHNPNGGLHDIFMTKSMAEAAEKLLQKKPESSGIIEYGFW